MHEGQGNEMVTLFRAAFTGGSPQKKTTRVKIAHGVHACTVSRVECFATRSPVL